MLKRDHMNNLIRNAPPVGVPKLFAVCVLMVGALAGYSGGSMTPNRQGTAPPTAQAAARTVAPPPSGPPANDPTAGVLPSYDDAFANWKNAGLASVGGIPSRTTVCATVNPRGGGQDDFTNIQ